jgi:hypothetical protein
LVRLGGIRIGLIRMGRGLIIRRKINPIGKEA